MHFYATIYWIDLAFYYSFKYIFLFQKFILISNWDNLDLEFSLFTFIPTFISEVSFFFILELICHSGHQISFAKTQSRALFLKYRGKYRSKKKYKRHITALSTMTHSASRLTTASNQLNWVWTRTAELSWHMGWAAQTHWPWHSHSELEVCGKKVVL